MASPSKTYRVLNPPVSFDVHVVVVFLSLERLKHRVHHRRVPSCTIVPPNVGPYACHGCFGNGWKLIAPFGHLTLLL